MADGMIGLRLLCEQMREVEIRKEEVEAALKQINAEYDMLRLRKIPETMEVLGVRNATFEGLGRVQLAEDIYASTREGQKEAGIQWLRDCGYDGMITEGYNASSAKALFRRMIKDGQPIPEEIFSITPFTRASIVKA
jgi:hypothetical protein